jgi:hypothetical protein
MDALLHEFVFQVKSNALMLTSLIGCFGYFFYLINRRIEDTNRETNRKIEDTNRETNRKIEDTSRKIEDTNRETNRKIEGVGMTIHSIEKQLPESIVHIVLTPSQASKAKDTNLQSLLDILLIDFPVISDCAPKPSKKNFSKVKFAWNWGNRPESGVYKPFIDAVSEALLALRLEIHDVSGGQLLYNQLLYTTNLCSLRVLDENGKKTGPVYYKGQIQGRTDLVVVDNKEKWGYILRHNVWFVVEVKLSLKSQSELASGLREATTQLLGLCGENPFRSPPVLLTDFVNEFIVVSLYRPSKIPLKFEIDARRFPDIASALSSAYELSMRSGISEDLGRNNTPEGSAEGEED